MQLKFRVAGLAGSVELAATWLLGEQVARALAGDEGAQPFELDLHVSHPETWEEDRASLIAEYDWDPEACETLQDVIVSSYTGELLGGLSEWQGLVKRMYSVAPNPDEARLASVAQEMFSQSDLERKQAEVADREASEQAQRESAFSALQRDARTFRKAEKSYTVATAARGQLSMLKGHIQALLTVSTRFGDKAGADRELAQFQFATGLHAPFRAREDGEADDETLRVLLQTNTALNHFSQAVQDELVDEADVMAVREALATLTFLRTYTGRPTVEQIAEYLPAKEDGGDSAAPGDTTRDDADEEEEGEEGEEGAEPEADGWAFVASTASEFRVVGLVAAAFVKALTSDEETELLGAMNDARDSSLFRQIIHTVLRRSEMISDLISLNPIIATTLLPRLGALGKPAEPADGGDEESEEEDEEEGDGGGADIGALAFLPSDILEAIALGARMDVASLGFVKQLQDTNSLSEKASAFLLDQWRERLAGSFQDIKSSLAAPRQAWGEPERPGSAAPSSGGETPSKSPSAQSVAKSVASSSASGKSSSSKPPSVHVEGASDDEEGADEEEEGAAEGEGENARMLELQQEQIPLLRKLQRLSPLLNAAAAVCGAESEATKAWANLIRSLITARQLSNVEFVLGSDVLDHILTGLTSAGVVSDDSEEDEGDDFSEEGDSEGEEEKDGEPQGKSTELLGSDADDDSVREPEFDLEFAAAQTKESSEVILKPILQVTEIAATQRAVLGSIRKNMRSALQLIQADDALMAKSSECLRRILGPETPKLSALDVKRLQLIDALEESVGYVA